MRHRGNRHVIRVTWCRQWIAGTSREPTGRQEKDAAGRETGRADRPALLAAAPASDFLDKIVARTSSSSGSLLCFITPTHLLTIASNRSSFVSFFVVVVGCSDAVFPQWRPSPWQLPSPPQASSPLSISAPGPPSLAPVPPCSSRTLRPGPPAPHYLSTKPPLSRKPRGSSLPRWRWPHLLAEAT